MVNVVIMRHGEAHAQANTDSERCLTDAGAAEVAQMANWLAQAYAAFDYIWVSPYQRTQQSAAIMLESQSVAAMTHQGKTAEHGVHVQVEPELVPDGNAQAVLNKVDALLAAEPDARVLLISHMPLVSFLVEAFTQPGQAPIFSTAGLCCIAYQPAKGGKLLEKNAPLDLLL